MAVYLYRTTLVVVALILLATGGPAVGRAALESRYRELQRRQAIRDSLFQAQRQVVEHPNRFKIVWTTRRAGKTTCALIDWILDALGHPYSQSVYIGITHSSAKRIAWLALKQLDRQWGLQARFQEAELRVNLPNGSNLQLFGADRPGLADRLLGTKLRRAYIDEAAFHSQDLTRLVDGVLLDAVSDEAGQIWLLSTPGILTRGLFYELTRKLPWQETFSGRTPPATDAYPAVSRWRVFRWTTAQNPYMAETFAREIAEARAANPDLDKDPEHIRNRLGAWVHCTGETVYRWDPERNTWPGQQWVTRPGDQFILGMDFGWDDRQAMSLVSYRDDSPILVEVEAIRLKQALMDELAARVKGYMTEYPGLTILGDPGSKQYFEEFRRAHSLPLIPAEKASKFEWIQIANTALRAGHIQIVAPSTSPHVDEMTNLIWTVKPDGTKVEARGLRNDSCDAFLYAFRHARHYMIGEQEPEPPAPTQQELYRQEEQELLAAMEDEYLNEDNWNDV